MMNKNVKCGIFLIIAVIVFTGCSKVVNTASNTSTSSEINTASSNNVNSKINTAGGTSANSEIDASLSAAVGKAVKNFGENSYSKGEFASEGHEILDVEEKNNVVKVYTISSFGYFGFQNGIFTIISGSGAIPTVITFSRNNNSYSLKEYKEPEDGSGYSESIKKMFPKKLWDKVLSKDDSVSSKLSTQQEAQAEQYLKSIGRTAKVDSGYVEKKLPAINVAASNKLFSEMTKDDSFLNNFPYWLGSKEKLENGQTYIYETSQSKTSDGYDLISFKKKKADGKVVEQRSYKIIGGEPVLQ